MDSFISLGLVRFGWRLEDVLLLLGGIFGGGGGGSIELFMLLILLMVVGIVDGEGISALPCC